MPKYDIFISYSRANTAQVKPLVELLRNAGYRVFFDQKEILIGEDWKRRLSDSVASARCLILCWSKESAASEFVRYELFRAEGLRRRVLPWLLDTTPLPELITIQGTPQVDPAAVVAALRPRLGMKLRTRRWLHAVAVVGVAVALVFAWHWTHRPWILKGSVRDVDSEGPLSDVTVEVILPGNHTYTTNTKADGGYTLALPLPRPQSVEMLFRKEGFSSDHPLEVTTARDYTEYLKVTASPNGQK